MTQPWGVQVVLRPSGCQEGLTPCHHILQSPNLMHMRNDASLNKASCLMKVS